MKDRNECYRKNQRIDKSHLKYKKEDCYSIVLRENYSCYPIYLLTIEISPRLSCNYSISISLSGGGTFMF